ncbi:MAG: hypothetical protein HXL33_07825 [Prevotellaceae bacterium]|nr:hypothetical protein [Prevotellaceae bacterium]
MAAVSSVVDGRHTHRSTVAVRTADGRRTLTFSEQRDRHYHITVCAFKAWQVGIKLNEGE